MSQNTGIPAQPVARGESSEKAKKDAMIKIETINAVEGFDPAPLALEIGNMNEGGVRHRLPVMVQMAWFRLKYPEGRIAVSVKSGKDYFVAEARVYAHYKDPADCYLAEGSASRGYLPDKPTVSPREWAQTAAIGIALRNAGFGLQFAVAGESFDDNALNELAGMSIKETSDSAGVPAPAADMATADPPETEPEQPRVQPAAQTQPPPQRPELSPLEKAMAMPCPIARYKDKTLGEVMRTDPGALAYVAKSGNKYGTEVADSAKLICEHALQQVSA